MKHFWLLFILITGISFVNADGAFAQKKKKKKKDKKENKKKEKKEWKKKMKQMDPLAFRDMTDQLNQLKRENSALKKQNLALQENKTDFSDEMKQKDDQIAQLQAQMDSVKSMVDNNVSSTGEDYTQGIVYKVQIGAFKNKSLNKYIKEGGGIWEEDADGMKKYTIAYFRDYWEADTFKKYMREMGVKDAWIVAYENNQRKDVKEVLDQKDIEKRQSQN